LNLSPVLQLALAVVSLPLVTRADRTPDVPDTLKVPDGNKVAFHAYAVGVQIYVWTVTSTGASWVFQAPEAVLFDSDGNVVGLHYAGPTWESNSGSKVVGQRLAGSTVDASAIPWLLLGAKSTQGSGIFASTTYVQRVNTSGGIAPATPGAAAGDVARVPYSAQYYFYRAHP
jgi:hypothetical protein